MKSLPPDDDHCGFVLEFRAYGWTHSLQMMITVASFEIASNISQDSYGLVFGINTFLALAFQVPSNFPFLNLRYKKDFIVCLETIQLSLSKLDFQEKLSLFVCKTDQTWNSFSLDNPHNGCGWQDRIPSGASRPGVSLFSFYSFVCFCCCYSLTR